jgi:hypothetical protein
MTLGEKVPYRGLTDNEALVVRRILGAGSESEENRVRMSGMPRTSYKEARSRVYALGILEDRYVPNPALLSIPTISFLVTHPAPGATVEAARLICNMKGAVVVWAGMEFVFGVLFQRSAAERSKIRKTVESMSILGEIRCIVSADTSQDSIPVYFDFEGAWSRITGSGSMQKYPRHLPTGGDAERTWPSARHVAPMVEELLRKPIEDSARNRPPHLLGPSLLPRNYRRLIDRGLVEWRTFLGVGRPIVYKGWKLSEVVIIYGRLKDDTGLYPLFQDLVTKCQVYPFLLAAGGGEMIMGNFAVEPVTNAENSGLRSSSQNVTRTISNHLESFRYVRESTESLSVLHSHRYDLVA